MQAQIYPYSLDRSSKKFICEGCQKKRMVRYKDNLTDEYLPAHVGKCERVNSCNYHYPPRQFFKDNPNYKNKHDEWRKSDAYKQRLKALAKPKPINSLPNAVMQGTMKQYEQNCFVQYLMSIFSTKITKHLIEQYNIGTSKRWQGSNVFWQVDHLGNVRQAKVMLYNTSTGKRVKEYEQPQVGRAKVFFAGKSILRKANIQEPNLKQCFFGEHLLSKYPNKKVIIVESEKTAILLSVLKPDMLWLATGGSHGCSWTDPITFSIFKGREVILYPDLGMYDEWNKKATALIQQGYQIRTSDFLEKLASDNDKQKGYDLADYFIKRDSHFGWAMNEHNYPLFWD